MPSIIGNFLSVLVELLLRYGKIYSKNVFNFLHLAESRSCVQRVKMGWCWATQSLMLHTCDVRKRVDFGAQHNKMGSYVSDERWKGGLEREFQSFLKDAYWTWFSQKLFFSLQCNLDAINLMSFFAINLCLFAKPLGLKFNCPPLFQSYELLIQH